MEQLGIILSEATTTEALCQLFESAESIGSESNKVFEGMLLVVQKTNPQVEILARVSEIIPYNEFYTKGDAWSEARRKEKAIPVDVARKWEVCKLELLREIGTNNQSISIPPHPGDGVFSLDIEDNMQRIFDIKENQQGIIELGALHGYPDGIKLPLNVENIPMHLAIFGITGSGKSYTAGTLIEKLLSIQTKNEKIVSYPMIIIDAHGDYVNYADEFNSDNHAHEKWSGAATKFSRFVFPTSNLLQHGASYIKNIGINLDKLDAGSLASLVVEYYKGETSSGSLSISGLDRILADLKQDGISFNKQISDTQTIEQAINNTSSSILASATKNAMKRAISHFREKIESTHKLLSSDSIMKNDDFIDNLTQNREVAVFDFSADGAPGVDLPTKQFILTYLAKLLFNKFTKYKMENKKRYLLFVIEEAQNFCPSKSYNVGIKMSYSTLQAIATQGRKFGLSLCLISQRPAFVDSVIISMCNSFLIHRIAPDDIEFVRKVTGGLPRSLARRLANLGRGELIVHGQITTIPFPMLIRIPKNDRIVDHIAGVTRVVEGIAEASGIDIQSDDS